MCRKRLRSSWLIFLGLICILGSAESYLADEYDEGGEDYLRQDADEELPELENRIVISKREPAFTPYISIGALSNMQQFFENLKENFHSLESLSQEERKALLGKHEQSAAENTNKSARYFCCHATPSTSPNLEIRPAFPVNALPQPASLGMNQTPMRPVLNPSPRSRPTLEQNAKMPSLDFLDDCTSGLLSEQETRIFRPPATAAYLHAVRNHRPSHKIRNFVANAEPPYLRGSNHYDPSYLWTGLGRRR